MKFKGMITLLMLGTVISTNATIARLKALGMRETDNEGSYYIKDDRNIFLNAAYINDYKDLLILEWGGSGSNFGSASLQTDKDGNPKAKGGFLKSHGDNVFGVYLGNESNTSSLLRGVGTAAYSSDAALSSTLGGQGADSMLDGADNQIDLFYGGSSSLGDWGVNLVYAEGKEASNRAYNISHAIRLGLKNNSWGAFANISTGTQANQVDNVTAISGDVYSEFDGKLGFHVGGHYDYKDGTIYGFLKKFDWEQTDSVGQTSSLTPANVNSAAPAPLGGLARNNRGQQGTVDGGFMTYALGYGHTYQSGKGTFFTNLEYRMKEIEVDFTSKAEAKNVIVPVTLAYEFTATDWLTLRGSVIHNLMGYRENNNYSSLGLFGNVAAIQEFGSDTGGKKVDIANSTDVTAGASLTFGRINIDGFIGTTNSARDATGSPRTIDTSENGNFSLDNLLTRVAMTYSF